MLNVTAFVGSYRNELSYSLTATNLLVENLKEKLNVEINYKCYKPNDLIIENCRGCCYCFLHGKCILQDDFEKIKADLVNSDIIIIASPVYCHSVSGITKTFIDRVAHFTHLFRLCGKACITLTVTDNNGESYVHDYLNKMMSYLGMCVVSEIDIFTAQLSLEALKSIIRVKSNNIVDTLTVGGLHVSKLQEQIFLENKKVYSKRNDFDFEKKFWIENRYFEYSKYQDLFESKKTKNLELLFEKK